MDFAFPTFVRASTDTNPPQPAQKSLLELVVEAGGKLGLVPHREAARREPWAGGRGRGLRGAGYRGRGRGGRGGGGYDNDEAWRIDAGDDDDDDDAASQPAPPPEMVIATRTSWIPPSYLLEYCCDRVFVDAFLHLHGVRCAQLSLLPPPVFSIEDLRLPPVIEVGLRQRLVRANELLSRGSAAASGASRDTGGGSAYGRGGGRGGRGGRSSGTFFSSNGLAASSVGGGEEERERLRVAKLEQLKELVFGNNGVNDLSLFTLSSSAADDTAALQEMDYDPTAFLEEDDDNEDDNGGDDENENGEQRKRRRGCSGEEEHMSGGGDLNPHHHHSRSEAGAGLEPSAGQYGQAAEGALAMNRGPHGRSGEQDSRGPRSMTEGHRRDDAAAQEAAPRGIQHLALPALLMGNHVLQCGPRGAGKRTAAYLAMACNTLARFHNSEVEREEEEAAEAAESAAPEKEEESSLERLAAAAAAVEAAENQGEDEAEKPTPTNAEDNTATAAPAGAVTVKKEREDTPPPDAVVPDRDRHTPRGLIVVHSFAELAECARWLLDVFGLYAFELLTFERGTCSLCAVELQEQRRDEALRALSATLPADPSPFTAMIPKMEIEESLVPTVASAPPAVPVSVESLLELVQGASLPSEEEATAPVPAPSVDELQRLLNVQGASTHHASLASGGAVDGSEGTSLVSPPPPLSSRDVSKDGHRSRNDHHRRHRSGRSTSVSRRSASTRRRRHRTRRSRSRSHRRTRSHSRRPRSPRDDRRKRRHRSDASRRSSDAGRDRPRRRQSRRPRRDDEGSKHKAKKERKDEERQEAEREQSGTRRGGVEEEEGPAARGTSTVTHAAKGDVPVLQTGAVDTTTTEATAAASVTCASLSTQPTPAVGDAAQTGNAIEAATTTDTPPAPTAVPPPRFITPGFFPTYLPGTTTTATTTTSSAAAPVTTFITPNHPFASPPDRASTAASIAPVPSVPYITTTAASSSTTDPRRSGGISAYDRRMAAAEQEALQWLPSYLKARIPLLLTTTLSLQEALTQCEGAASELPLELVRFCVLTGAERLLLPPTKESFSNAYWMSLCTAMDVECQFAFTADRMFEEVREFVEHTILPDSADDTIVLEQADQSIWAFLRPVIHSVTVEGTGREIAPPPGEDADGRPSRWQRHNSGGGGGGPRVTPEDIEVAKLTRTTHLIVDHFAQRARESAMKGEEKAQDGSGGGLGHSPWQGARVVVFTSTRREQTSVMTRLQVLLREHPTERRAALLRLTTVSEHFSREQADVLVLCEAQLQDTRELRALGYCRQIGLLLHFSLPRNVMMGLPGDIADCLAARARAVLGPQRKLLFTRWLPTVMADAAAGNDAEAKERDVKVPTVLLLTEHNLNGKVGLTAMEALRPYGGDSLVMESMEGESERQ